MSQRPPLPPPSDLDAHLGYWLRAVSNHVSARFEATLDAQGSSVSEWVVLRLLFDRESATHAELIQALGMTKGATSKLVSRLEEKALVRRRLAQGRAREQAISLTRAGRERVPRLAALADANDAHCFGHLDARQRASLLAAFKALATHHALNAPPLH